MGDRTRTRPKLPLSDRIYIWIGERVPWEYRLPFVALGMGALGIYLLPDSGSETGVPWWAVAVGALAAAAIWARELLRAPGTTKKESRAPLVAGALIVGVAAGYRLLSDTAQAVVSSVLAGFLLVSAIALVALIPVRYRQGLSTWHDRARDAEHAERR